jgi:hypothetical protein
MINIEETTPVLNVLNTVRNGRSQNVHHNLPVAHRTAVSPCLMLGLHSWITDVMVQLSLFTQWRRTAGAEVQLHALFAFGTRQRSVVTFVPGHLTHGKRTVVRPESEAGWAPELVCMFWRKNSCHSRDSTLVHPAHSQSLDRLCCLASFPESWHTAKFHSMKQCPPHYSLIWFDLFHF